MNRPRLIRDKLSRVAVHTVSRFGASELAIGTSFIYKLEEQLFLVTARHNVTGRHAETGATLHSQAAIPDNLALAMFKSDGPGWIGVQVDLYDSDGRPDWFEHPTLGARVDAVALTIDLPGEVRPYPINCGEFEAVPLEPGLDVYLLGYPKGMTGGGLFPIWKRGSIATEPDIDVDNLPKVLIDTATREGMSGAPVVAQIVGCWAPEGATHADQNVIGRGRRILGLYSGRVGDDEFRAQLGTVWKLDALVEIMTARSRPTSDVRPDIRPGA